MFELQHCDFYLTGYFVDNDNFSKVIKTQIIFIIYKFGQFFELVVERLANEIAAVRVLAELFFGVNVDEIDDFVEILANDQFGVKF